MSKNILAGVVLHLVEEGKLSLDDDITKYVAEAPTHGQHVTLRHLLTHTSGLFSYTSVPDADANEALDLSHEQVLALIKDRPADFAPGASWRYSNTGSYLAGMRGRGGNKSESERADEVGTNLKSRYRQFRF